MSASDRPLFRQMVKMGTRLLLGRSRAHVQDWFPGLKIEKAAAIKAGAAFYRGRKVVDLLSSDALSARAGEEINIVGSGPSIRGVDMARIPAQTAILLNGAISLARDEVKQPLAIAVEDERFIHRHFDMLRALVPGEAIFLLSVSAIRGICEKDSDFLSGRAVVLIDNIRRPYGDTYRSLDQACQIGAVLRDDARQAGISLKPDQGVFQAGSVAVSALQFALFCRPRRIGFFGIDISNAAAEPRFYEEGQGGVTKGAFSGVARAEDSILAHFTLAQTVAAQRGIELLNFSPVSALSKIGLEYDGRYAVASTE